MSTPPILTSGDTRAVLGAFSTEPVSLAALKASGVAIEWHEGVAIVQEASRHLLESSSHQSGSALSAANVRIDLSGTVFVPRGGVQDGPSAVSQIGALLRDLVPDTMPVPLRLAISQAMSNPPQHTSIKSFSEALSYFERPDRTGTIRALYERWEVNASVLPAAQSRYEPVSESHPAAHEAARQEPRTRRATVMQRRIVVAVGISLAITLGLILATVWARSSNEQTVGGRTESSAASSDRSAAAGTVASAARQVARRDTTTIPVPASAATAAPAAEAQTAAPIQNARLDSERGLPTSAAVSVWPLASIGTARNRPLEASRQPAHQPNALANQAGGSVAITVFELAPRSHIYSALDTEVVAPVPSYPQSPTVATVFHDDEVLTFDVVIDQTGKVESVKLRRAPSSVRSTLMLIMSMSVAKAWRFQPATRNGQSVRYRQSISVPAPQ